MKTSIYFDPDLTDLEVAAKNNSRFGIATAYQGIADQLAEAAKVANPNITCKRGCAACCSGSAILITTVEVAIIETKSNRRRKDSITHRQNLMGEPCPFLGSEQECTIYEFRPAVCRSLVSFDDAQKCLTEMPGRDAVSLDNVKSHLMKMIENRGLHHHMKNRVGTTVDIRDAF